MGPSVLKRLKEWAPWRSKQIEVIEQKNGQLRDERCGGKGLAAWGTRHSPVHRLAHSGARWSRQGWRWPSLFRALHPVALQLGLPGSGGRSARLPRIPLSTLEWTHPGRTNRVRDLRQCHHSHDYPLLVKTPFNKILALAYLLCIVLLGETWSHAHKDGNGGYKTIDRQGGVRNRDHLSPHTLGGISCCWNSCCFEQSAFGFDWHP